MHPVTPTLKNVILVACAITDACVQAGHVKTPMRAGSEDASNMSLLFLSLMLLITVSMSFICQVALLCPTSLSDGDMLETVYVIVSLSGSEMNRYFAKRKEYHARAACVVLSLLWFTVLLYGFPLHSCILVSYVSE